ncbi:hypothetical protein EDD18DRAFT_771327 [Armillaria luteobubalina]|uniref:Uncharacterized protein n=1 Tax=Armillaria luteobubalina TaxID=153913 RepID=A0AA39PD29_9AGAR|nr:hypothetical protein EDD18DRAFT_771327 [Armillaria luteobubalina]
MLVAAGPSNSVADEEGMYWMTCKWKNSGDGSSGSPYSSFRYMPDIIGCNITAATSGGVTPWALIPDDESAAVFTVATSRKGMTRTFSRSPCFWFFCRHRRNPHFFPLRRPPTSSPRLSKL